MTTERDEAVRAVQTAIAEADGYADEFDYYRPHALAAIAALRDGEGSRDWHEDAAHENGSYFCICIECGEQFTGHKRRVVCRTCSNAAPQPEAQAVIPKAKDWLEQINGAASREWMDGWDACRVEYELFLATQQPEAQAVAWPEGLIDRIKSAEQRIHDNHAPRRIPADPTDVDLVLAEVRLLLEGKPAPFWLKPTTPAAEPSSEGVRVLVAKWRALAQVIREMKGGRNYRFPGKGQIAAHIDDCADELEAALAPKPAKGGEGCWCRQCRPVTMNDCRMPLCPGCGNKRCPKANDHRNGCTGSNEPGQPGSAYPATKENGNG